MVFKRFRRGMSGDMDYEEGITKEEYVEVGVSESRMPGKIGISIERLEEFADTDRVLKDVREGTLVFLRIKNLKDKAKKERLLYGNWEYDDDPSWLIDSYDLLLDIFKNEGERGKKYITCDAARFGSDKAIILVWDGYVIIDYHTFDISKTTEISAKIKEFQAKYTVGSSNTVVDSDGVGGGVVDEVGCIGFVNNSSPAKTKDNQNFDNLQSQCGYFLADMAAGRRP